MAVLPLLRRFAEQVQGNFAIFLASQVRRRSYADRSIEASVQWQRLLLITGERNHNVYIAHGKKVACKRDSLA